MARKHKSSDKKLAKQILESAQEIWLAGLGVFTKAEQEGGKIFETLVTEGQKMEARSRKIVDRAFDEAKNKAGGNWQQLERMFEQRVVESLRRLGIPDRSELTALQHRIAELDAAVTAFAAARQTPDIATSRITPVNEYDDLTVIKGIGPKMAQRLAAAGIHSYRQIAGWQEADIEYFQQEISGRQFKARIREERWVEQALQLHQHKYGAPE